MSRAEHLKECLETLKLELREDSVICNNYINGSDQKTTDTIVHEMAIMHWLHNYTTYKRDVERMVDHLLKTEGVHKGIWRRASHHVKAYLVACRWPEQWPWMTDVDESQPTSRSSEEKS